MTKTHRHKRGTQGIALYLVMILTGLLLLMMGAFVTVHRGQFSLITGDQHHQASVEGAHSIFDYCHYRLTHNRYWKGEADGALDQVLVIEEFIDGTPASIMKGRLLRSQVTFEVEVLNNIAGTGQVDGVVPGATRLRIATSRGSSTVRREATLIMAPIYDGSAVAAEGIHVDLNGELILESVDPNRNRMRSKGEIQVPSYDGGTRFVSPPGASEHGVLWAGQGITMGSANLSDPDNLLQAMEATLGQFFPNAPTHYNIHDLQLSEVRTPEDEVEIQSGAYIFSMGEVVYENEDGDLDLTHIPMLQRLEITWSEDGAVYGTVQEYWYQETELPHDAADDAWTHLRGSWGSVTGTAITEDSFTIVEDSSGNPVIKGQFKATGYTRRGHPWSADRPALLIDSGVNVRVNGDFALGSNNWNGHTPIIAFQDFEKAALYNSDGFNEDALGSGGITTMGDLTIAGRLQGSAKFVAQDDVTLRPSEADIDSEDLAIYSGKTVRILDATNTTQEGSGTISFKGMIYAKNDIIYDAADKNVDIEGALIAQSGRLTIQNAQDVHLIYNPEYLKSILKDLPEDRVHLELLIWKEN